MASYKSDSNKYLEAIKNFYILLNIEQNGNGEIYYIQGLAALYIALNGNPKYFDTALTYFNDAIRLKYNNYIIYYNIGLIFSHTKRYEKAIENFRKSEYYIHNKNHPNDDEAHIYFSLASALYKFNKHNFKESFDYYYKSLNKINKDYHLKINIYYNIGILYLEYEKDYDKAIENFDKAIKIINDIKIFDSAPYINKGYALIKKKENDKAIECFEEVLIKSKSPIATFSMFNNIYNILKDNNNKLNFYLKNIICHDMKNERNDNIEYLYKYRDFNEYSLNLIKNQKIYLSNFMEFNDPADPPIRLDKDLFDRTYETTQHIKICSLSSSNDNILMWSHYSNSHKGFCIQYDFRNINLIEIFKNKNAILKKVLYKDKINFSSLYGFLLSDFQRQIGNINEYYESMENNPDFLYLFYTKYTPWKYENEYRVLSFGNFNIFIDIPIKSIFIGKDAEEHNIEEIRKIIKNKNIELFQMISNSSNLFELKYIKI